MRNRRALVTGSGRGIGAAIAKSLAGNGIDLYLHYHQSFEGVQKVLEYCERQGVEAVTVSADLRSLAEMEQLFKQLPGSPDILVNNAGCEHHGLVTDVSLADWEKVINLNIRSAFFCAQKALPHMIRQNNGRIVNVSSIWGMTGAANEVLYSLSKGAMQSFTQALAKEVATHHITVNAIAPGVIQTEMMDRFTSEEKKEITDSIPLQRWGKPEEAASLVSYLVSEPAGYITGQIISPNGGLVI